MFHSNLDHLRNPPLESRPNTKPGDHDTPNAHNSWFILFYHVRGPAWIEIRWNSIWLKARSRMTSHYTWRSVTTLHEFGGVLGRQPLDTFFRALTVSWSRHSVHVCSGPLVMWSKASDESGGRDYYVVEADRDTNQIWWNPHGTSSVTDHFFPTYLACSQLGDSGQLLCNSSLDCGSSVLCMGLERTSSKHRNPIMYYCDRKSCRSQCHQDFDWCGDISGIILSSGVCKSSVNVH